MEQRTVYRIRYTLDNRIKAVEATQEPVRGERSNDRAAWFVVILGALAAVGWWMLWI